MKPVRVRFAPSPTGALHLGGARTALFNWLFARHHGGKFILRIEDTDQARSTKEAVKTILNGLNWLGIYQDEGPACGGPFEPYLQAERLTLYKKYAQQLIKKGKAYYYACASEKTKAPHNNHPVLRFKIDKNGQTKFTDLCRGNVKFKNEIFDDFIIIKSDGFPTYNFAAVVDDHLMEISHVIRGDDHLSNTPRQILIYQAFGWEIPRFGHLPMLLGKDKTRLSKRHGAKPVTTYAKDGFLPEAVVNFLARLGWGYGSQEIFSREELIKLFTLEKVTKSPAVFDTDKLIWLNNQYIKKAVPERVFDLCLPFLEKAYHGFKLDYAKKVVAILQDRLKVIADIVPLSEYFFKDVTVYEEKAARQHFKDQATIKLLEKLKVLLGTLEKFDKPNIEKIFKSLAEASGLKLGAIIHPARLALTGRSYSPGIYAVVEVLGAKKVIQRLDQAIKFISL